MPDAWLLAELLLLGAAGGLLAGMLGVGGGMILVPFTAALLEARGFPPALVLKVAVATSLAMICFTALSSLRAHHLRGAVAWPLVLALSPGIVVGSVIGAQVASALPVRALTLVFAGFVAVMATRMLRASQHTADRPLPGWPVVSAMGAAIGFVASLVGAGGAFLSVPFMTAHRVPMHRAVGTSAALGLPVALAGSVGYAWAGWSVEGLPAHTLGYVYLPALIALSVASVPAAPLGARLAHRLDVRQLRRAFALLLYAIAAAMLLRAF